MAGDPRPGMGFNTGGGTGGKRGGLNGSSGGSNNSGKYNSLKDLQNAYLRDHPDYDPSKERSGWDIVSDWAWGKDATPPEFDFQYLQGGYGPGMGGPGQEVSEQMRRAMLGQAPSAAQLQMQDALGRATSGAQAMSVSNPSVSAGLAQRNAMNQAAQMGGQVARDTGILRAQEMAGARGQMADWLAQQKQFEMQDQVRRQEEQNLMNQLMFKQELARSGLSETKGFFGEPSDILSQGGQAVSDYYSRKD